MCIGCAAVACGITGIAWGGVYYSDTKGERIIRGAFFRISSEYDCRAYAFNNRGIWGAFMQRYGDVFRTAFLFHLCLRSHRQDQQRGKR